MSAPFAILFWSVAMVYALAAAGQVFGHVFGKRRFVHASFFGLAGGLAAHTALVLWRWIATGHIPTIGNFENALFGSWFIALATLLASRRHALLAAGALPFALLIYGVGGLSDSSPSPLVASLQSFWLYIHIFFAWLAYGGYTVACGAGIVYLVRTRRGRDPGAEARARLDELMFRSTAFGFITDAVMIAAGSLWAKKLWGSYWSWDPVETWSLLSFLSYGIALHLRTTRGWRGRRLAWVLVFAILGVLVSFWGVNLVMRGSAHVFNVG